MAGGVTGQQGGQLGVDSHLVCNGCKQICADTLAREVHEARCRAVAICPGCDARLSRAGFRQHLEARLCEAAQCGVCSVVFSCEEELSDHCAQQHGGRGLLPRKAMERSLKKPPLHRKSASASLSSTLAAEVSTRRCEGATVLGTTRMSVTADLCSNNESMSALATPRSRELVRHGGSIIFGAAAAHCPGCARRFASQEKLTAHLLQPAAQRRPPCSARACIGCGEICANQKQSDMHEADCPRLFRCPGCPRVFRSEDLLNQHVSSSRQACPARSCSGCGLLFADAKSCAEHETSCELIAVCLGCKRRFASPAEVAAHVRRPPRMRPSCPAAACVGCGLACSSAQACAAHEDMCWRVFTCPGCPGHFGSADAFQAHLRNEAQRGDRTADVCHAAQCDVCGQIFGSSEECESHQRRHFGGRRRGRPMRPSSSSRGDPAATQATRGAAGETAAGAQVGGAASGGSDGTSQPNPMTFAPNIQSEDSGVAQSPQEIMREISAEVAVLEGAALRKRLRELQLQWHPDRAWRCNVDTTVACEVFAFVQSIWEAR